MSEPRAPAPSADVRASIAEAVAWQTFVADVESVQRAREQDDLAYQRPEGAWSQADLDARGPLAPGQPGYPAAAGGITIPGRPIISIAFLDEPIQLVAAQERSANLGINIHALSQDASDETAQIFQGIYRTIERASKAHHARSWAYTRGLWAGRGAYRVDKIHDPESDDPFDQTLRINRILDQSSVFFDPYAVQPDWSDGLRAQVIVTLSWGSYRRKYPRSRVASFDDAGLTTLATDFTGWITGDSDENRTVRVCEDWRVEITTKTQVLLDDGSAAFDDAIPEGRTAKTGPEARSRPVDTRRVFYRTINCYEELEPEQEWDGDAIPIVPTVARELHPVNGTRSWIGMVANAKGAVKLGDFSASSAVEMAALEPKAPWQAGEGIFKGHENEYLLSNTRSLLLQFATTDLLGNPVNEITQPKRVQVDVSRLGPSMQLLGMARDFVQTATSTYDPALGKQPTAHRSGKAIEALQGQSVESNSPYLDNQANLTLAYEANNVIVPMIAKLFDRPGRIARILDAHGHSSQVMVNHPFVPGAKGQPPQPLPYGTPEERTATDALVADETHPAKHYDLTKGRYGIEVTIGKASLSADDQAQSGMGQLLQAEPALFPLFGPEYLRSMREPWADTAADIAEKQRAHAMPWLSPETTTQDPAALAQQLAQVSHAAQQMKMQLDTDHVKSAAQIQMKQMDIDLKKWQAQFDRDTKIVVAEIGAKVDHFGAKLDALLDQQGQVFEAQEAAKDRAHDAGLAAQDHAQTIQQADQQHAQTLQQGDQQHQQTLDQQQQSADLAPPPAAAGPA